MITIQRRIWRFDFVLQVAEDGIQASYFSADLVVFSTRVSAFAVECFAEGHDDDDVGWRGSKAHFDGVISCFRQLEMVFCVDSCCASAPHLELDLKCDGGAGNASLGQVR